MRPTRPRRLLRVVVRVLVLGAATCMLSLSGGAPSWTDSIQPRPDRPSAVPNDGPAPSRP